MKNIKQTADNIVAWLKDYAVTNNRNGFVLGVSGGVDSALVSTLCAMTGLKTVVATLPLKSRSNETDRGNLHIDWLKKNFSNVVGTSMNLDAAFDGFKNSLPEEFNTELGFANSKSRLRMIALYQLATAIGGLVVGTGNKVEDFGVGFFTKYGDGGVDISPIGDLTKTEVRAMCRELNVLPELAEAVPTDGLWDDGRTDEGQLGATYEELEWAMIQPSYISIDDMLKYTSRQVEILRTYQKWHVAGQHKLKMPPVYELRFNEI